MLRISSKAMACVDMRTERVVDLTAVIAKGPWTMPMEQWRQQTMRDARAHT